MNNLSAIRFKVGSKILKMSSPTMLSVGLDEAPQSFDLHCDLSLGGYNFPLGIGRGDPHTLHGNSCAESDWRRCLYLLSFLLWRHPVNHSSLPTTSHQVSHLPWRFLCLIREKLRQSWSEFTRQTMVDLVPGHSKRVPTLNVHSLR